MFGLIEPKIKCEKMSPDETYGCFVVEPLEEGYGVTLGNSLRRILLSSLPGAAVTSVRIDGVLHEFTVIPGVREDVSELILNLKSLVLKMHNPGMKIARIEKTGPGTITGRDIVVDPDVDIVNPDVYIAELDEDGSLFMELTVEDGRGYITAEVNKEKMSAQALGTIAMDSRFTPITRVNFQVEDTRVGQRTDYDKLIMEVWTDGSVKPDESIEIAAGILIDHLEIFKNLGERIKEDAEEEEEPEEKSELDKLMEMPIEDLELSMRAFNCLKRAGVNTLGELVQKTEAEISKVRNMGKKSLAEVKSKMAEFGLAFRLEDE